MKKYRVTYKNLEADGRPAKVEEVEADVWRVDDGYVALYRQEGDLVTQLGLGRSALLGHVLTLARNC